LQATTLAPGSGTTPVIAQGAAARASGDTSLELSFALDRPGTLHYVVAYQSMFARFGNNYVVFDTSVPDISRLIRADLTSFTDGMVARGAIPVGQGSQQFVCRVGGSNAGLQCNCGDGPCNTEAKCFGSLCTFSKHALAANTTYRVGRCMAGECMAGECCACCACSSAQVLDPRGMQ
jgi:hypothetical protein